MPWLCNIQHVEVTAADAMHWLPVPGVSVDSSRFAHAKTCSQVLSNTSAADLQGGINKMHIARA